MVVRIERRERCLGRLVITWCAYGVAAALLWRALAPLPWGQALSWVLALAAGCLLLAIGEV